MERRLAAILAADVVGYTRLMGADEAGTLRRLTNLRERVLQPLVSKHHGRIVKLIGDGMLVEFASAVDSVTCALAWQSGVAQHEMQSDTDSALRFRIGINLGDVIAEDGDIHGDGVNIAARLESLAEPGSICLSEDIYRHAKGKVDTLFEDIGKHDLKNVSEPVHVYRIATDGQDQIVAKPDKKSLRLPDKPSIAVLPFESMSVDEENTFLGDGIAEDILTAMSRFPDLFVIDRHSSFSYKNKSVSCKVIGAELGVRYVLEGSVRQSARRVRITAQLIDAPSGNHLWAERYDRTLDDIFALQDEITRNVVMEISDKAAYGKYAARWQRDTEDFEAWSLAQRAAPEFFYFTKEGFENAIRLFEKAVVLDPNFGSAYAGIAWCYQLLGMYYSADPAANYAMAREYVEKARGYVNAKPWCLNLLAQHKLNERLYDEAITLSKEALALAPNSAELHYFLGKAQLYAGFPTEAITQTSRAMRISPFYPNYFLVTMLEAYRISGELDNALAWAQKLVERMPESYLSHLRLTAVLSLLGRETEAREAGRTTIARYPDFSLGVYAASQPYRHAEHLDTMIEALRAAGLPD